MKIFINFFNSHSHSRYDKKIFKINFSKNLLKCTYFGKQWWGDEISGKWIDKSIKFKKPKKKELNLFFEHDLIYFFTLSRCIIIFIKIKAY